MQGQISSSWRTITDPKAVKVLFDIGHRARLAPFFERAQTVSEVAERLGEDAGRLYYFVQRYVGLDLLEIVRTEPRPGRALRYYRATAEQFFVPLEHTPTPSVEGALFDVHAPLLERFSRNFANAVEGHLIGVWGRRFYRDPQGTLSAQAGPAPDYEFNIFDFYSRPEFPPASVLWQEVYLTPENAKTLQVEFNRLIERLERCDGKPGEGKARYLVKVGITPIKE